MQLLLKNVRVCTPDELAAPQDIRIDDGIIRAIGKSLPMEQGVQELRFEQEVVVSPGWLDVGVQTGDPGFEHREDLHSVAQAAAAGGFTALATAPNTAPAIDNKSAIVYIQNKTAGLPISFYPIGAISVGTKGNDLAELYDMHTAGAIAFSDGNQPLQDSGLLLRSLQYVRAFDGLIIHQPHHQGIATGGQMHEGLVSTRLGLKGLPALAEAVTIQSDISLLEYAESRLHLHLISTKTGVDLVRAAKAAGLNITASAALSNLCFTDEKLESFDSNWKLMPPLRDQQHREALLAGIADGTIDFIASNHIPWDTEAKNLEFPFAKFGTIGLETAFALCRTYLRKQLSLQQLTQLWAINPRKVLGIPVPEIKPGVPANLSLFAPDERWTVNEQDLRSKSHNSAFLGQELTGKVLGIINNGQLQLR